MRLAAVVTLATVVVCGHVPLPLAAQVAIPERKTSGQTQEATAQFARLRMQADVAALQTYRPGFQFWRYIFTIADGSIVFGSNVDGRLLATFPASGDWQTAGTWETPELGQVLEGRELASDLADRRDEVVQLLTPVVGPVLHNATRGLFLIPNERRYGAFLEEWGEIFERFGVPAEVGLAQALVESGFDGSAKSEAQAIGFCQWLLPNWNRLKKLSSAVIEGYNQTTQAPYCAAALSILATKYGSFIPALSEHHAGGTNIGRTLINGERLGGATTRDRYFLGSDFARDLRVMSPGTYRDVYGSYGPRSIRYAEMVFGNVANIERIRTTVPQLKIHAMRLEREQTLAEVARRAKLSPDEVRRYNPALSRRVPADATVYLPRYISAFGRDVAFWHRPASGAYATALDEFLRLNVTPEEWDSPEFDEVLEKFRTRFAETKTEEGAVMAATLAYAMQDRRTSQQAEILAEFRTSAEIRQLFDEARLMRAEFLATTTASAGTTLTTH
jgi:hypothetical protein